MVDCIVDYYVGLDVEVVVFDMVGGGDGIFVCMCCNIVLGIDYVDLVYGGCVIGC